MKNMLKNYDLLYEYVLLIWYNLVKTNERPVAQNPVPHCLTATIPGAGQPCYWFPDTCII